MRFDIQSINMYTYFLDLIEESISHSSMVLKQDDSSYGINDGYDL
jgi:hypothetical protein